MIRFIGEPSAGKDFEYVIEGDRGVRHRVEAYVNGQIIYSKEPDCPDPPCHEMISMKDEYAGQILNIKYENILGQSERFSFNIGFRYLEL